MKSRSFIPAVIFAVLFSLWGIQSLVLPRWILSKVGESLGVRVQGRIFPAFLGCSFTVKSLRLHWKDKVRVEEGQIRLSYAIASLLNAEGVRIQVEGRLLRVRLLGDWQYLSVGQSQLIDKVFADFVFNSDGLKQILTLDVSSPALSLQIGTSLKKKADVTAASTRTVHET